MNRNYKIVENLAVDPADMRTAYCETLMELAENDRDILIMDADLLNASGCARFRSRFPEQVVDCGIQEANMVGTAAGLSIVGKKPFAHSFAAFVSRRCFDQAFISVGFAKANVKLIGSDPGVTAAENGATHQGMEDMGLMCAIPGNIVLDPSDNTMCRSLIKQLAAYNGISYMRLYRKPMAKLYEDGSEFEIGKAVPVREGSDVTVIASGICVAEALKAADILRSEDISAAVTDCFTWKPLDKTAIIAAAEKTGAIVTVENHNVMTGLAAAVSPVVVGSCPVPMEALGVPDSFGEVGPIPYLTEHFGFACGDIVEACRRVVARKKGRR